MNIVLFVPYPSIFKNQKLGFTKKKKKCKKWPCLQKKKMQSNKI